MSSVKGILYCEGEILKNLFLFLTSCLIWGSTWLIIKFQLGVVDPLVSVTYRFLLAGLILLIYSKLKKINLKYGLKDHFWLAMQGVFLFGINYWLVYLAEVNLTSALVAVVFSTLVFMNVINGLIFLRTPIKRHMSIGAVVGMSGIALAHRRPTAKDRPLLAGQRW